MIWGCFVGNKLGPIAFINDTVNSDVYIDILRNNLLRYLAQNGTSQAISGHRNPLWTSSYNSAETQGEIDGGMMGHWGGSA